MKRITGQYQKIANLDYFIPDSLPPKNPVLELDAKTIEIYGNTMQNLGQLNGMSIRFPDHKRFIKAYVIKEALLSCEIEGIHTTILDVFAQSIPENKPNKETQLVLNYTEAVDLAIDMITKKGLPISSRVILATHEELMSKGESDRSNPGQFRKQPVKVGSLVPPPAQQIPELILELEKFINYNKDFPPLIQAGLAHVQFETIHPFLDGNGRIGRLLIVLMLIESNILIMPIIYPSYYFKKHRMEYYARLDAIRTEGDFEGWIYYYLNAINQSCIDALTRAKEIQELESKLQNQLLENQKFSKVRIEISNLVSILFQYPVLSINDLAAHIDKSYNSAAKLVDLLLELRILVEQTEQKRNKLYIFQSYIDLLEKEYDENKS